MPQLTRWNNGFTLIELMIVVAIIAILAGIGYPMYTDQVIRGKRSEGRALLVDTAARLERYFSDNNKYATATNTIPTGAGILTTSENGHYTLTITVATPFQTYTLNATPATFSDAECGVLTLTQSGQKGEGGTATDIKKCWGK